MFPELDSVAFSQRPFEHFVGRGELPATALGWLDWLETEAPWRLVSTEFYEQHECNLLDVAASAAVWSLACPDTTVALRSQMSERFGRPLSERVDVTAHKLVPEQTIRIHNDYIRDGESHRLLLQLNRAWEPAHGGYLMLFDGPQPETASQLVEPRHGSVQAFAISARSHHAVSTVHAGERFTVVYSFYPAAQ